MKKYRKPHRIRKKKPIFRNRFFWLGILVLVVTGTIFYFLFFSEFFQVGKIIISGEEKVSKEEIKLFVPRKNMFLIDTAKIGKDILDSFPQIAEVEVGRGFPDAINILIIERIAVAVWCEDYNPPQAGSRSQSERAPENCFLVDRQGVVFEKAPPETDLIRIFGEKELLTKEKLNQFLEIQSKLKEILDILITEALFVSEQRSNLKTSEGWEIYFNLKGDLDWQITELGLILEKQIPPKKRGELEYIDLRFSRVYYKFR